jgi:rhomboid protease GluP
VYRVLRGSVIAFLAFNLLFGLSVQGIDMAAHLGGLAAGCLIGAVLARPLSEDAAAGRIWRNLLVAVLGVVGLVAAARSMPEAPGDFLGAFTGFVAVEKQAVAASRAADDKWRAGQLSDEQFADILARDVLAPWRDARERLAAIRNPPPQRAALLARLLEYAQLRQEGWEATVQWLRTKDPSKIGEANRKMHAADAVVKEINAADGGSR